MPEDSEIRYTFNIGTRNMDFISKYLNGLKLKELESIVLRQSKPL